MNSIDSTLGWRINHPMMEFYRYAFADSPMWSGEDLSDKTILVYMEQGFGDCIQFARYLPLFDKLGCRRVIIYCPKELHLLFAGGIGNPRLKTEHLLWEKFTWDLPPHDYHVLSFSIPFLLGKHLDDGAHTGFPYFYVGPAEVGEGKKIGIAWEVTNRDSEIRSCPLRYFKALNGKGRIFSLHPQISISGLLDGAGDFELYSTEIDNFRDTAELIRAMDVVVTVDTCIVHLAGALGVPTHLLLTPATDGRFGFEKTTRWYPSVTIHRTWETGWEVALQAAARSI